MNDNGNYSATLVVFSSAMVECAGFASMSGDSRMEDPHKDNSHDGENHDRSALPHGLIAIFHGLPRLNDSSLLLLEVQ